LKTYRQDAKDAKKGIITTEITERTETAAGLIIIVVKLNTFFDWTAVSSRAQ
jgi:hypothetical protein